MLNYFKFRDVILAVWVPDGTTIFDRWQQKLFVSIFFELFMTGM